MLPGTTSLLPNSDTEHKTGQELLESLQTEMSEIQLTDSNRSNVSYIKYSNKMILNCVMGISQKYFRLRISRLNKSERSFEILIHRQATISRREGLILSDFPKYTHLVNFFL